MNNVNLPPDPKLAGKIVDIQAGHETQKLDMGLFGRVFGSKSGAPANAASFVVFGSFITMVALLIWGADTTSFSKKDAVLAISNLLTLALGFLFGKGAKD